MLDILKEAEFVIGLLITLFGVFSGAIIWLDRRQKATARSAVKEATGQSHALSAKVGELEGDVKAVADDVKNVRREVGALGLRVHTVERSLETVARQGDIAALNGELKLLTGSVTAQLTALSGMMHSFRESALRAAEKGQNS